MTFHDLQAKLLENYTKLCQECGSAFQTDAEKGKLWETYIESFPAYKNPVYRVRREYDCSCCRHFIMDIGGVLFIDDDYIPRSIWQFEIDDPAFRQVLQAMDTYVKSRNIVGPFFSKYDSVGTIRTRDYADGIMIEWEHFWVPVPEDMRYTGYDTIESVRSSMRDTARVFRRSLEEISPEAVSMVLELIRSNNLYRGTEWLRPLELFRKCQEEYAELSLEKRIFYAWKTAPKVGLAVGRIRGHSIGVLLTDVSGGMELDDAVSRYEKIVAPANYKRPKAIFTKRMLEDARKKIEELGYTDSMARRYARLDDIRVNNILFANRDAVGRMDGGVFDQLMGEISAAPKKFDRVQEISAEAFVRDVLPGAREVEAYVENRHAPNLVSLIAPVNPEAPSMFKWNNPFSWAYTGNMTDSDIRRNVKNAGGNVDGVLRFSIQWNDTDEYSRNDLDAHCIEPSGFEIYYARRRNLATYGQLDVDISHPDRGEPAVENITWPAKQLMKPGRYKFFVHQFNNRGGRDGFRAEISFDGKVFRYDYRKELRQSEKVPVADVILEKNGTFRIEKKLPSSAASRELWGVRTQTFVPVSVVMYSPNYWDEQSGIGNRHYLFMLNGCVNPEQPNGFYNEFLKQELLEHKRVFEALGGKLAVAPAEDQLSGLGFSATLRNELIVLVKGATERVMKIKF